MIIKSKLQFFILFIFLGAMSLLNSNALAATPIDCGQPFAGSIMGSKLQLLNPRRLRSSSVHLVPLRKLWRVPGGKVLFA